MHRRTLGVLVLLAALVAVLAAGAVTGRTVTGRPERIALVSPPPVGSCLQLVGAAWSVSDCARSHTAEVARTWPAVHIGTTNLYDSCVMAAQTYLGASSVLLPGSAWMAPPVMHTQMLLAGPTPAVVDAWSGRACAIRPIVAGLPEGFRGRLAGAAQSGATPVDLRTCYDRPDVDAGLVDVSCSAPHVGQILAVQMLRLPQPNQIRDKDPAVRAQCRRIADASADIVGPVRARDLSVVVYLHATGMGSLTSKTSNRSVGGTATSYTLYEASCSVQIGPTT